MYPHFCWDSHRYILPNTLLTQEKLCLVRTCKSLRSALPQSHVTRGRADKPDRRVHLQSEPTNTCNHTAVNSTELKLGLPRKFKMYKMEE